MTLAFSRMATVTASTKRAVFALGKQGDPATNIASLKCTPLDPLGADDIRRLNLNTPGQVLETFVDASVDIIIGDRLVVGSREYPVRAAEDWAWMGGTYRHLVLDNLKAKE